MAQNRPDCICVQELKAQSADMQGRFEELAGLSGHFHLLNPCRLLCLLGLLLLLNLLYLWSLLDR